PGHPGADQDLGLVAEQLRAPVGQPHDLDPELLDRTAELMAVLLDRCADLLRAAGGHQSPPPGLTVARIFLASSMASLGVGAPTFSLRHANMKVPPVATARTAR